MINITNMRLKRMKSIRAEFEAHIYGWVIRECVIVERPDGNLAALPPIIRNGIRAVTIAEEHWFPFVKAAVAEYRRVIKEPAEAAGLMRLLSAVSEEALKKAV